MKKKRMESILLAAMIMTCLMGCGSKAAEPENLMNATTETVTEGLTSEETMAEEDAAVEGTAVADTANANAGDEDVSEDITENLVTIQDIYDANGITDVLSRHKTIVIDYRSVQGLDDVLASAKAQITQRDDGDVLFVEKMDNGENVYDIQSYENSGFVYVYNETTKEAAVGILHPDEYIYYIQQRAYLEPYASYEYSNIENAQQDGDIVVYADIDDIGQVYIYAKPDTYDIDAIAHDFTSGVHDNHSLIYDRPEDLGITVLDDALAEGSSTVTIKYLNGLEEYQNIDYELPVGATAYMIGTMEFDFYTDAECSDDNYIAEFTVEDHPMTIYAKYVG